MKKYKVTEARWANWRDMQLPFYQEWNAQNASLPRDYKNIWAYPFIVLQVPLNSNCAEITKDSNSACRDRENFPDTHSVNLQQLNSIEDNQYDYSICVNAVEHLGCVNEALDQILRVTKKKAVLVLEINENEHFDAQNFTNVMRHLNFTPSSPPADSISADDDQLREWGRQPNMARRGGRIFGVVIEASDATPSCGIIIPHWENYRFAAGAIRLARQNSSETLRQHIYLIDDESKDGSFEELKKDFASADDVSLYQISRDDKPIANVGKLIDFALERVHEKYVCSIDADTFPISTHWLTFPIWLLEKYQCSMVGCDTGITNAYIPISGRRWQNMDGYNPGFCLYDNGYFTGCNNFFRVMKTSLAKIVAQQASFSKALPRAQQRRTPIKKIMQLFQDKQSKDIHDYPGYIDNGILAYYFVDVNRLGPKFSIPIISWVGFTPQDGVFGQNVCGLVLHFALSRSLSSRPREIAEPGVEYRQYAEKILTRGLSDELLQEMLSECILRPGGYDGSVPVEWYQNAQDSFENEFRLYLESADSE